MFQLLATSEKLAMLKLQNNFAKKILAVLNVSTFSNTSKISNAKKILALLNVSTFSKVREISNTNFLK